MEELGGTLATRSGLSGYAASGELIEVSAADVREIKDSVAVLERQVQRLAERLASVHQIVQNIDSHLSLANRVQNPIDPRTGRATR